MESMKRITREWRPSTTAESRHLAQALATIEQDSMRYKNMKTKPWLDAEGKMLWSPLQIRLAKIIFSQYFETLMGLIIFGNIFLIVYETNADAGCHPEFSGELHNCPTGSNASIWSWVANVALQVIYTAECLARMFVERSNFVRNRWNLIDLFIVLVGWLGMGLSEMVSFNVVRIFRVVRLLRAGRLLLSVPELYILLNGLTTSFKAIFFGSILLIAVVFVWAIVTVELLHPVNVELGYDATCPKCAEGFQTVYRASLTLFSQVVAGDNWGAISLPLAERHPWTAPILFGICMTISLGVMNLILAVIVEKAAESRQNDLDRKVEEKNMEREKTMVELAMLCDRMDKDHSGSLSLEEMMNGYVHEKKFFALMQGAGIEKNDLETIFNVMDTDNSGEVDYVEFCSEVGQCHKRDPMMLASMTRYSLLELRKMIHQEVMETLQMQTQMLREQLDLLAHVPGCEKEAAKLRQRRILAQGSSVGHLKASDSFQAIEHKLSSLEVWASQIKEVWHGSEDGAPSDSSARSRDVGHDWKEIDEQLRDLGSRFNVRIQVEAALRQRCQEMMEKLTGDVQANLLVSDIY